MLIKNYIVTFNLRRF